MISVKGYSRYVSVMCGICGLIFGIDLGIVGAALPYIKATVGFTEGQLSSVTAAVLLGSVFGTIVAAAVAEKFGRVMAIRLAAAVFTLSVPLICFSNGDFSMMYAGRILQGLGCGLACVSGPLYLAECMSAAKRGRGAGMFQLVIVIGLFVAALVGLVVAAVLGAATDPAVSVELKMVAWKAIFWSSAVPGGFLFVGSFYLKESPRWLSRRGRRDEALAALRAGNPEEEARLVMDEIIASEEAEKREKEELAAKQKGDTVFRRRYMIPFLLSVGVAVLVQASGINSVLNYSVMIMDRAGFREIWANWADVAIKAANFLMTIVACFLVDRKGRKFLLTVGSGGLLVGTLCVGGVFLGIERFGIAPSLTTGLVTLAAFILYVSAFAVGPGVCVHLALTELMPTRIRAGGMLVATMCNNAVSFTIAQTFLPWSKAWGSSAVFFTLSGFMVVFFILVTVFLPETKGRSLEEIERMFAKAPKAALRASVVLLAFLLPAVSFAAEPTLGQYASGVRERVVAKVREALADNGRAAEVSGVVTLASDGHFFIQNGQDAIKVQHGGGLPKAGDRVAVSGTPTLEGGRIVFAAKKWTKTGTEEIPAARTVKAAELVDPEENLNWLRVTVEGRAIGVTEGGFAVNVDDVPVNVMVEDLPGFLKDCERTHPKVRITGIAEQMLDPSALLGRAGYVMGVKVNLAGPGDAVLEPDLAYLAACRDKRFEIAVGIILGLLAVGLFVFAFVIFRQRRGLFRTRTIMAERKRMADDIHDTIEQHLVGAGMLLKLNKLKEAQDVLVRAKREIRDIVWGLKNDDMMRLSPAEMLRQIAHEENTKGIYRIDTRLEGLPETMDAAAMRDLSLIVRESIGNAVKHGGAKKIAVSSDPLENGGWMLRLSNDGTPFDPATAPGAKEGHFGLEGMKQRARRIGATVRFERRGVGMVLILEKRA